MASKIFDFFFFAAIITAFLACGFMFLLLDIHTESQFTCSMVGCITFVFPSLLMAGLMGADWIDENISVD